MALFEWDQDRLSVGVDKFDEHHKKMVDLINELHDAMKSGEAKERLEDILAELKDYTEYHFEAEEEVMDEYDYPNLGEQEHEHEDYVDKIGEFEEDLKSGNITLTMDIMNFLKDWLSNHIQGTDMEYKEFFEDKDV